MEMSRRTEISSLFELKVEIWAPIEDVTVRRRIRTRFGSPQISPRRSPVERVTSSMQTSPPQNNCGTPLIPCSPSRSLYSGTGREDSTQASLRIYLLFFKFNLPHTCSTPNNGLGLEDNVDNVEILAITINRYYLVPVIRQHGRIIAHHGLG